MFDRIRELLSDDPDPITVRIDELPERFGSEIDAQIDQLRHEATEHKDAIEDAIEDLSSVLDILRTYEGENARVDDITTNVAERRERAINNFDPPSDPDAFLEAAKDLTDDLSMVKQKEKVILDQAGEAADDVFSRVRAIEDSVQEMDSFLSGGYRPVKTYDRIDELLDRIDRLESERQDLQDKLRSLEIPETAERLEEIEQEIEDLSEHPEQQEKERIEEAIAEKRSDMEDIQQSIQQAASSLDRGLRKLLYAVEDGAIEIDDEHVEMLQTIKDGDITAETDPETVSQSLEDARDHLDEIDISERQREVFEEAASDLMELGDLQERIEDVRDEIDDLKDDLDALEIDEIRSDLQSQRNDALEELNRQEQEKEQLEQRLAIKNGVIQETREKIESLLDEAVRAPVTVVSEED